MKWVYSNSTFSLDTLIYENRQTSFYNYDCIKKLYDQIEIFLKLSLYPDGDSILRKLSFNRPEFKKILKIEKLTYHMNIDPESQKNDPGQNPDLFDHNINLKEKASLFITNAPIENKVKNSLLQLTFQVAILFFGSINLNMTSRLIENIYYDLGSFENDIIKINCVNFKIGFQDNDLHKRDSNLNYEK